MLKSEIVKPQLPHSWGRVPILALNSSHIFVSLVSQQRRLQRAPGAALQHNWSIQPPTQRQESNRCCDKIKVLPNVAEELCVADSCCPYFDLSSFFWGVCLACREEHGKHYIHIHTQVASSWYSKPEIHFLCYLCDFTCCPAAVKSLQLRKKGFNWSC